MSTDAELLRRYVAEKSEAAFAELVQRHLPLVYSAALRQVGGDAHLAQDVAQQVFIALARKAPTLVDRKTLAGWLYLSTHHAAAQAVRSRQRRQTRETEAHVMQELLGSASLDWQRLRPVLDDAMGELSETDREAVLLRYFEQRPFAEVGAALNLGEDAARMRVERALDKLHALLVKRGITSTTAALALALQGNVVAAVPAGLATNIIGGTLAAGSAAAAGGIFMSSSIFAPAVTTVAAAVSLGAAFLTQRSRSSAAQELTEVSRQRVVAAAEVAKLKTDLERATRELTAMPAPPAGRAPATSSPTSTTMTAPRTSAGTEADLQAGRDFLAAHPEAQALLEGAVRSLGNDRNLAVRSLGLTPEEQQRIETFLLRSTSVSIGLPGYAFQLGPGHDGQPDNTEQQLTELLGEARYLELKRLESVMRDRSIVRALAGTVAGSDMPLTAEQATALNSLIEANRQMKGSTPGPRSQRIDWNTIAESASGVLSPPQLALFKTLAAREAQKGMR